VIEGVEFDVVTWVPCSFLRRLRRGYDQSRLLAVKLSRIVNKPAIKLLKRKGFAKPQYTLDSADERTQNVAGQYVYIGKAAHSAVLLVDDIFTTGATFRECASVLHAAGAERVILCALARKPRERRAAKNS
jgi:competence protein ComFC